LVTSQVNHSFDFPFRAHLSFPGVEQEVPALAAAEDALLEGEGDAWDAIADADFLAADFDAFGVLDEAGAEAAELALIAL
jgi:hypothetical protein